MSAVELSSLDFSGELNLSHDDVPSSLLLHEALAHYLVMNQEVMEAVFLAFLREHLDDLLFLLIEASQVGPLEPVQPYLLEGFHCDYDEISNWDGIEEVFLFLQDSVWTYLIVSLLLVFLHSELKKSIV